MAKKEMEFHTTVVNADHQIRFPEPLVKALTVAFMAWVDAGKPDELPRPIRLEAASYTAE